MATKTSSSPKRKRKNHWARKLKIALLLLFILGVFVSGAGYLAWMGEVSKAGEKVSKLENFRIQLATNPTIIRSADGKELFTLSAEFRKPVKIGDIPQKVKDATIVAEDRRFYEHTGIDTTAILRQLFTNVKERRIAGGASTLTMQLAKRIYSKSEKTFRRKLEDMAMAVQIERRYTKDEILEMYLNQVFYGSGAYGIKAAADVYFGKELDELTYAESAMLARCVRLPSQENPFSNLEKAIENRNFVLSEMLDEGKITNEQYEQAIKEKPKLRPRLRYGPRGKKLAPYFVDYVLSVVRREFPDIDLSQGGYTIDTTLNLQMQQIAEKEVRRLVDRYKSSRVRTGAFLMTDRDGRILAMVGGGDYKRNEFNVVTQGRRQPGSAFKPFVYAIALMRGDLSPSGHISNERYTLHIPGQPDWSPANAHGRYGGTVSVASAIAHSINVPAARTLNELIGLDTFIRVAPPIFGFKTKLTPAPSLALGSKELSPVELAEGYSVFMREGDRFIPFGISQIRGSDDSIIRSYRPSIRSRVLPRDTAITIDGFLREVVTRGTARKAGKVVNARGKTGTTNDNTDVWFCGYSDQFLGIAWFANEMIDPKTGEKRYAPMRSDVYGGSHAAELWANIISECQSLTKEQIAKQPERSAQSMTEVSPPAPREPSPPVQDDRVPDEPPAENPPAALPPDTPVQSEPSEPAEASPPPPTTKTDTGTSEPASTVSNTNTVTVMICADTGKLARVACPEQVPRTFRKGREPMELCTKHRL